VEQADLAPVMGALLEEVVGPDVIGALGPQPDARSIIQPQASALGLSGGDLQPLASPDPFDPLVVDQPACPAQQLGDLAVAVATILPSQLDHVLRQPRCPAVPCAASSGAARAPHRHAARKS